MSASIRERGGRPARSAPAKRAQRRPPRHRRACPEPRLARWHGGPAGATVPATRAPDHVRRRLERPMRPAREATGGTGTSRGGVQRMTRLSSLPLRLTALLGSAVIIAAACSPAAPASVAPDVERRRRKPATRQHGTVRTGLLPGGRQLRLRDRGLQRPDRLDQGDRRQFGRVHPVRTGRRVPVQGRVHVAGHQRLRLPDGDRLAVARPCSGTRTARAPTS